MNWLEKIASPEGWLRQQGVPAEIIEYALDDNRFPRKMQKWVALHLNKKWKDPDVAMVNSPVDFEPQLIEIRDWFNYMSRREQGFDIMRYSWEEAETAVNEWQGRMEEERGKGHANLYTQPDYNAEDLGNGFRMVEVVPDDLKNEGAIMQHCVGDDEQEYREHVTEGKTRIFSLRDRKGWPHATIEVSTDWDFDINEYDETSEEWEYDETGRLVPPEYLKEWEVVQVQGKQNEPPVNKYRPYVKAWLTAHKEDFKVTEDQLLSVSPEEELIPMILADPSNANVFRQVHQYLSSDGKGIVANKILEDKGEGWSPEAVEHMIVKLTEVYPYGGNDQLTSDEARAKRKEILTGFLSTDYADVIRSRAMHSMSVDLIGAAKRDPATKEWLKNIVMTEESSPGVADAALKLLATQIEDHPKTPGGRPTYYDEYSEEILPIALEVSERFQGHPASPDLQTHIADTALRSPIDNQTAATLIERAMIKSIVSTYELRASLNKVEPRRFYDIWRLLSDKTREKLMRDDERRYPSRTGYPDVSAPGETIVYENMNEHQFMLDAWREYQEEWERYDHNRRYAPRLQEPEVQPPEWQDAWVRNTPENEQLMEDNYRKLRQQGSADNWLQKICTTIPTENMLEHAIKAVMITLPGSWEVVENRPDLKQTYHLQQYGRATLRGTDLYQPGDEFSVNIFAKVRRGPQRIPEEIYYNPEASERWIEENTVRVPDFDSSSGHPLVLYHARVVGFIPGRNLSHYEKLPYLSTEDKPMYELGNTQGDQAWGGNQEDSPVFTPFDLANWVRETIERGYQDFGGGEGNEDDTPPLFPEWPYPETDIQEEETAYVPSRPRIRGRYHELA